MARPPRPLDTPHLAFLAEYVRRTSVGGPRVDSTVRSAVDVVTAAADPARAQRLAVRPGEPREIVERLLVWALHRTTDEALSRATQLLDALVSPGPEVRGGDCVAACRPAA